jgi:serine/threonine protein kinase
VLKVASKPEHNDRLRQEFDVLGRLRHPNVVAPFAFLEFGPIHGFTMERAGEETLAQRLRKDEKLEIDLLERFGDELLQAVDYLDKEGIAHRDLKPDNLGVRSVAKGPLRLVLFDFSLSNSPLEDIRLGTPPYLEPFLANRKVRRWDAYAERFAAAVTLMKWRPAPPRAGVTGARRTS